MRFEPFLKKKITSLLSDLDSTKINQEAIIERYEKKLKEKNEAITRLEQTGLGDDQAFLFHQAVLQEIRLMISIPVNVSNEQFLETVKNLRKDYRKLRGFDEGSE